MGEKVSLPLSGGFLREELLVEEAGLRQVQPFGEVRNDQAEEVGEKCAQQCLEQPIVIGWHGAPQERPPGRPVDTDRSPPP